MRDEPYLNKKKRQRMAKKKKSGATMEDIGTPRKKRGRPPKRSLSVENLTAIGVSRVTNKSDTMQYVLDKFFNMYN